MATSVSGTTGRYERLGRLVAEEHREGPNVWSYSAIVYRCRECSALVDHDHLVDHQAWHAQEILKRVSHLAERKAAKK